MSDYITNGTELQSVANAIRTKGGSTALLVYPNGFVNAINAIEVGVDTSDANATASDMLSGKTAYVDGQKITGNIPSKSSANLTVSGATVTASADYYSTAATKTIDSGSTTQNAPTINSSTGLVTATATVTAGYQAADTKSNTLQLTTQAAQTITPGTTNQTIAAGKYLTGAQTIAGDSNLVAANIAQGVSIFGVSGTHSGGISIGNIGAFAIQSAAPAAYPFLLGMTWRQFLDSDFSTAGFRIENNRVQYYLHPDWRNVGNPVLQPTDIIINTHYYETYNAVLSYNITVLIDSPYNNDTAHAEPSTFRANETLITLVAFPGDGLFDHWEIPSDIGYDVVDGDIYSEQCTIIIYDESNSAITAVFTG